MTPFFSIIIPVYNVAPYLRECLDSVLTQTFGDWEAICVDDGSTDGSGAILDDYSTADARFRVFHQTNVGVGPTRNQALDLVRGRFVVFLDGDDVLSKHTLSVHQEVWTRYPDLDCSYMELIRFQEGKPGFSEPTQCLDIRVKDISKKIDEPLNRRYFSQYSFSLSLIREIRFPPLVCGEDGVFLGLALDKARRVAKIGFVGYGYRQREGSASFTQRSATARQFLGWMEQNKSILAIMEGSSKEYGPACYRSLFLEMTQYLASVFQHLGKTDRRSVFPHWRESFEYACAKQGFSQSEKARFWLLSRLNNQSVVFFVCGWRLWCSQHGIRKSRLTFWKPRNFTNE